MEDANNFTLLSLKHVNFSLGSFPNLSSVSRSPLHSHFSFPSLLKSLFHLKSLLLFRIHCKSATNRLLLIAKYFHSTSHEIILMQFQFHSVVFANLKCQTERSINTFQMLPLKSNNIITVLLKFNVFYLQLTSDMYKKI